VLRITQSVLSERAPFDIVVIGAGMHGGCCAEKIYRFAREQAKPIRILVLDSGSVLRT
jgi:glycine/D-amino acid oxidase-like deaminating enzyme